MEQSNQPVYLTLSLPSGNRGKALKDAIRELAQGNQRSVSNQCVMILESNLIERGKLSPFQQETGGEGG